MQVNTSHTQTVSALPDLLFPEAQGCSSVIRMDLDHLLLAIEAIDLQATDVILDLVEQLKLYDAIPNRVSLWRLRNTNPYRRNYQRGTLSWQEAKALVLIICTIARKINTHLRLLITTSYQHSEGKIELLGLQQNLGYVESYLQQFHELFLSRMRSPLDESEIKDLANHLLVQLLFCGSSLGELRLWNSLLGSNSLSSGSVS
jgi:hypothetical protein